MDIDQHEDATIVWLQEMRPCISADSAPEMAESPCQSAPHESGSSGLSLTVPCAHDIQCMLSAA